MNPATYIAGLLLADSTYSLMTPAERRAEALELLKSAGLDDDPLDAAAAVEEADERLARGETPETPVTAPALGIEPCREKWGESCTKPVSATGRCMECGARRREEENPQLALYALAMKGEEAPAPDPAHYGEPDSLLPGSPLLAGVLLSPMPAQDPDGYKTPPPGFLSRFKATTGNNDRQIGDLMGLARSSVQAIIGGRCGENFTPSQLETIDGALTSQLAALLKLRAEIRNAN